MTTSQCALVGAALAFAVYLLGAFTFADLNIAHWGIGGRFIVALLMVPAATLPLLTRASQ